MLLLKLWKITNLVIFHSLKKLNRKKNTKVGLRRNHYPVWVYPSMKGYSRFSNDKLASSCNVSDIGELQLYRSQTTRALASIKLFTMWVTWTFASSILVSFCWARRLKRGSEPHWCLLKSQPELWPHFVTRSSQQIVKLWFFWQNMKL